MRAGPVEGCVDGRGWRAPGGRTTGLTLGDPGRVTPFAVTPFGAEPFGADPFGFELGCGRTAGFLATGGRAPNCGFPTVVRLVTVG